MRFYRAHSGRPKGAAPTIFIFALFLLLGSSFAVQRLNPLAEAAAATKANVYLQRLCDEVVLSYLDESGVGYRDLILLEKTVDGEINAVMANTVAVNRMKSSITQTLSDRIGALDKWSLAVPFGTMLNAEYLSGWGPRIPITVTPNGRVTAELKSEFSAAAINQTVHRLVLETKLDISLLMPVAKTTTTVKTQVPIAETIIVGKVPQSYTNIEGVTESAPDTALNLMD